MLAPDRRRVFPWLRPASRPKPLLNPNGILPRSPGLASLRALPWVNRPTASQPQRGCGDFCISDGGVGLQFAAVLERNGHGDGILMDV